MSSTPFSHPSLSEFASLLPLVSQHITSRSQSLPSLPTLAEPSALQAAKQLLPGDLPEEGWGTEKAVRFLLDVVGPALAGGQAGPRYFGFVTGGVLPVAQLADILVGSYDQNVQVHLANDTLSTVLESTTLKLCLDLLDLPESDFPARTFTTGATASNTLALASARDALFLSSLHLPPDYSIAEDGFPSLPGGGPAIEVLTVKAHASLIKAAAVVGIGRKNVVPMDSTEAGGLGFDYALLERRLEKNHREGRGSIVAVGFGEVNTGGFTPHIDLIRKLCDQFGAWLHVDAAFGAFVNLVPSHAHLGKHLALADSITADGHKWLNVPYACGLYFAKHNNSLQRTFGPSPSTGGPAYLTASSNDIPSPLFVNIENSRRFQALPVFAALTALGRNGYADLIARNMRFATRLAHWMEKGKLFEVLNPKDLNVSVDGEEETALPLNIVLFRVHPDHAGRCGISDGAALAKKVNEARVTYISATAWDGKSAVRLAVSNWMTGLGGEEELKIVTDALEDAVKPL